MNRAHQSRIACAIAIGAAVFLASAPGALAQPLPASCAFTDNPLVPGQVIIKAVHVQELRACINELRVQRGLLAVNWTDPVITPQQTTVKAIHVSELRTSLGAAYIAAGLTPPDFGPPPTPFSTVVRASDFVFLRNASIALANCSYQISPTSVSVSSQSINGVIDVAANAGCVWHAASQADWIHLTTGTSGMGSGITEYTIDANPGTALRFSTIDIAGHVFSIEQAGAPINPPTTTSEHVWEKTTGDAPSAVYNWHTPYGDEHMRCRFKVTVPNTYVNVVVTIIGPDGSLSVPGFGYQHASATVDYGSIFDHSPGEFRCVGQYTAGFSAGSAEVTARSSNFFGSYERFTHDYDVIWYVARGGCSIPGMYEERMMSQAAPGYPNIAQPPVYMADEGVRWMPQGGAPLYINYYLPADFPRPCIAAP